MLTAEKIAKSTAYKKFTSKLDIATLNPQYFFENIDTDFPIIKEIYTFLNKFSLCFRSSETPFISKKDLEILYALQKHSQNEIFTVYIGYLISCGGSEADKKDFLNIALIIIIKIIKCFEKSTDFAIYHSFRFFLNKLFELSSYKEKKEAINKCIDAMWKLDVNNLNRLAAILFLLKLKCSELSSSLKDEIIKISKYTVENFFNQKNLNHHAIQLIEQLLDELISFDKITYKIKQAEFLLNNQNKYNNNKKQEKLMKAVKLLKEANAPIKIINKAKNALALANKTIASNWIPIDAPFPEESLEIIRRYQEQLEEDYKELSNLQRLIELLIKLPLLKCFAIDELIYENLKANPLLEIFSHTYLDRDNKIIKNKQTSNKGSLSAHYPIHIDITLACYAYPIMKIFMKYFKLDKKCKEFLLVTLSSNPICEIERRDYVYKVICGIFEKDFDIQLRNIIAELEAGFRHFFIQKGIPPFKIIDMNQVNIDINAILKKAKNNEYRNCLAEYLEEDFLFTLEYLLTINPGGNIRNDALHGNMHPSEMNDYKSIYLMFIIIKLYLGFYCTL